METEHIQKNGRPNQGVRCVVNSCYYYLSGDCCGAEHIEVRPRNASTNEETDCATFKLAPEEDNGARIPPQLY